jgi:hypothetical protein
MDSQQQYQTESPMKKRRLVEGENDVSKSVEHCKTKKRAHIYRISEPDIVKNNIKTGALIKSKMVNLVPLTTKDDKPFLIQLSGGGKIPKMFGVEENKEKQNKFSITFNVDNDDDHNNLEILRDSLAQLCVNEWSAWFPDSKKPVDEVLLNMCNNLVSTKKKKKDSDGYWSGTMKTAVDGIDLTNGNCVIIDKDSKNVLPIEELPGMNWHRAIVELRHVYIQATKSYGITRKIRFLECSENNMAESVIPLE